MKTQLVRYIYIKESFRLIKEKLNKQFFLKPYVFIPGIGIIALLLVFSTLIIYTWYHLPPIENLKNVELTLPLRIYSKEGQLMAVIGEIRRTPIKIKNTPKVLIQAILAAEDDEFYQHSGVDYKGLIRAALNLVRTNSRSQGGSTITMQVARNFYLSNERTYSRKFNEILLSWKIESELSKDEILELYINKIFLGNRAYGFAAAAEVYYGQAVEKMDLAQIAMLAGLPKAPSKFNPIVNPKRALVRRDYVLKRMLELKYIETAAYQIAVATADTSNVHALQVDVNAPFVAETVREELIQRYGPDVYNKGLSIYTTIDAKLQHAANQALRRGLLNYDKRHGFRGPVYHVDIKDYTSPELWGEVLDAYPVVNGLRPGLVLQVENQQIKVFVEEVGHISIDWAQMVWARPYVHVDEVGPVPAKAGDILNPGDVIYVEQENNRWGLSQLPEVEGALVGLSPQDGSIKALVGGFDFFNNKYNHVTQARRQPGSSFKPFIYAAALDKGLTAATLVNDAPVVKDWGQETEWRPEDADGDFLGPTRLRMALAKSRNLVAIRVLQDIGIDYTLNYLEHFGFKSAFLPKDLTLALGSGEVTPLELARGYAVFANSGYLVEPTLIDRIVDNKGQEIAVTPPIRQCDQCNTSAPLTSSPASALFVGPEKPIRLVPRRISEQNAYIISSMMHDVIEYGTATAAKQLGRQDLAGKTGTTNNQFDAWFSGFNRDLVATAWVGFDRPSTLGRKEYGGRAALPIWIDFMGEALRSQADVPLTMPKDLVMVRIDPATGQRAQPGDQNAIFEVFMPGTVPQEEAAPPADNSIPGELTPITPF